jgi:hypothetical protein
MVLSRLIDCTLFAILAIALAGCSRRTSVDAAGPAVEKPVARPLDGGDFRGFRWGDPKKVVAEAEKARSEVVNEGLLYRTNVGGGPVLVSYGYDDGDLLGAAAYSFPWPGETETCRGILSAGSDCSLKSAEYSLETCRRIGTLLSEKYHEMGAADQYRSIPAPTSPSEMDRQLQTLDTRMDIGYRQWSSPRVLIVQFFERGRQANEGWRCRFSYYPAEALAVEQARKAKSAEDEAAKKEL